MQGLDFFPIECRGFALRIPKHGHAGELGNHFLEQLQPLSGQLWGNLRQARDVAAGPRQTLNQAQRTGSPADAMTIGIAFDLLNSTGRVDTHDKNDVNLETEELGCEVSEAIAICPGRSGTRC